MELADMERIMSGTEDDIRAEITNAGGFATESQVQALTGARNKTLLKKANYLSNVLQAKNDYVDRIVSLTQADRKQVSEDLDRKLGITKTLFDMSQSMTNAARDNFKTIVNSVGWEGLAQSIGDNPQSQAYVENLFGLPEGGLEYLSSYKKPLTASEQLDLDNQRLQNLKLQRDLAGGSGGDNLQFISGSANQPAGVFNKSTGVFTPITGSKDDTLQIAYQQGTINEIDNLVKSAALGGAVGPSHSLGLIGTNIGRSIFDFSAEKSNFIAGVEQLREQLTLDKLIQAKASGATFGALSDGERQTLAAAATKLGTYAVKDKNGNIIGYNANESDFKAELNKINNFARLDYILKGGDPASVGVQALPDGTFWVRNADGSLTKIR